MPTGCECFQKATSSCGGPAPQRTFSKRKDINDAHEGKNNGLLPDNDGARQGIRIVRRCGQTESKDEPNHSHLTEYAMQDVGSIFMF